MEEVSGSYIFWSIKWSLWGQAGKVVLNLLVNITLLRLLDPSVFGVMAMAIVFCGFLNLFISLGTETSLIYSSDIRQLILSSIFWLNFFSGLFFGFIFILSGRWLACFYEEPSLEFLSVFFGLYLWLQSLPVVPLALLQKNMSFKRLFWVELTPLVCSGAAAILLAYEGWGIYSLIVQMLLQVGLLFTLALWSSAWLPSRQFSFQNIKPHLKFGGPLIVEGILNFFVRNIDDLLIGKFLGNNTLGLYNKSYNILLFPISNLSRVISRVLFPSFSIMKEDKHQIRKHFLRACRGIALIVFPSAALLFLTSEELVLAILGVNWLGAIPLIRVFSILAAFQSIGTLSGVLFQSMGTTRLQMQVGLFVKPFMIGMIIVGLVITQSALGVAQFYTIASIIAIFPELFFSGRLIGLSLEKLSEELSFPFLVSLACAFFVEISCLVFLSLEGALGRLLVKFLVFVITYILALGILPGGHWKEMLELVRKLFKTDTKQSA